jgi:hypothetical protein
VETWISADGLSIVNRTERIHLFYDGEVERTARQTEDGSWHVTTRGIGNNVIPGMNWINEWLGPGIFKTEDERMRNNVRAHHGR